ncbi:unnamed protein product [Notodromas monacha]|uniref:DNA polymerase delta subunit 3 n=1 Tax=Notodromas monacha TaxID=399045 RepID=A0A7R9BV35_9CRUS|nr:unnamed protein product [Notodromas monacha]CAG0920768.1 unnamed protein product [Notodromas monacha]
MTVTDDKLLKLEEFVYDVQRTITPRWLSHELGIPLIETNSLLKKFVKNEEKKARWKDVKVIFAVTGESKTSRSHFEVALATSEDVDKVKARFRNCAAEIYCLHPSHASVKPTASILNANQEHLSESVCDLGKYDTIRSKISKQPRTNDEVEELRKAAFKTSESLGFIKNQVASKPTKANSEKTVNKSTAVKNEEVAVTRSFSDPIQKKTSPTKKPTNPKNALSAMFSKQAEKNKTAPPKQASLPVEVEVTAEVKEEAISLPENKKSEDIPKPREAQKRKPTKDSKGSSKPPAKKKKEETKKTQRKRIIALLSDSEEESDDEANDKRLRADDEEVVTVQKPDLESSDEEEVVPSTPLPAKEPRPASGKHKVKQWVEKTFLDDEGFMVTEKVIEEIEIDEDGTEETERTSPIKPPTPKKEQKDEKEKENKENTKKNEEKSHGKGRPKKPVATSSGKQSSIMNFFSKAK